MNNKVSKGSWMVKPASNSKNLLICIDETGEVLAAISPTLEGQPNYADAALMCASKAGLETMIAISETLNTSKDVIDLEALNVIVSAYFEKIAAESGEI